MSHLKRLSGTKRSLKTIPYRLKRSTGTECQRLTDLFQLKRSIGTKCRNKSYFVPHKTFSRDKTRTNCRPHLPTHQDNHTGNRTPIRQTKRQRNGSTDMDTVPRKIGIQRIIRADPPRLSEKSSRDRNTPYPYTRPKADSRFSLRNV